MYVFSHHLLHQSRWPDPNLDVKSVSDSFSIGTLTRVTPLVDRPPVYGLSPSDVRTHYTPSRKGCPVDHKLLCFVLDPKAIVLRAMPISCSSQEVGGEIT